MGSIEDFSGKESGSPLRVLVIGGSYGGLAAGLNLLDLCNGKPGRFSQDKESSGSTPPPKFPVQIKFVDERDGYYHLIGSPLSLASEEFAPKAWTRFQDLPALRAPGISWAQGSAVNVDCEKKIARIKDSNTGKEYEESYDYLVASSGLRRTWPVVPQSLRRDDYLVEVGGHIKVVKNAREGVVVIGGGAVGVEMAAELKLVQSQQKVTLIHSRDKLLSSEPLPDDFKDRSLEILEETGVKVILGHRVTDAKPVKTDDGSPLFNLTLSDGTKMQAGHVIFAISHSIPTTNYLPSKVIDNEGYVKVNSSMNFPTTIPNSLHHFAIGDICAWSGIKRCGAAMAMGYNAAVNIHQQLLQKYHGKEPKFVEFPEVPPMIALAIGKKAVLYGPEQGTVSGEDMMEMMFGDDLGYTICWNYLKLGVDGSKIVEEVVDNEKRKDVEVEVAVIDTTAKMEAIVV